MRHLVTALACLLAATACTGSPKQIVPENPSAPSLRALPNMIAYPTKGLGSGTPYGYGSAGSWPGDTPTHCDDLANENVTGLTQVGFITEISSDETGSLGSVGDAKGTVKVFTAHRTQQGHYRVIVAEPYKGCFVVYSPMV